MNRDKFEVALAIGAIGWRKHALERMFQRNISRSDVKKVLEYGEIIENYKDDMPYESALFLNIDVIPLHVVASFDEEQMIVYVITAYVPNNENFEDDFKTRRRNDDR